MLRDWITIFFLFFSTTAQSQWAHHHSYYIPPPGPFGTTYEFLGGVMLNEDTGYYAYNRHTPSPSSGSTYYVKGTYNDCASWFTVTSQGGSLAFRGKEVRKFNGEAYFVTVQFQTVVLQIHATGQPTHVNYSPARYIDCWMDGSAYGKLIYTPNHWNTPPFILKSGTNTTSNTLDTFTTSLPMKLNFLSDSIGYMLAINPPNNSRTDIIKYTNQNGYSTVFNDTNVNLKNLFFVHEAVGYAIGDSGLVVRTLDGGQSWTYLTTGQTSENHSLFFISDSVGFVGTSDGDILRTDDFGVTWTLQQTPYIYPISNIDFIDDNVGFAYTLGNILKTNNGGVTWLDENTAGEDEIKAFPNPTYGPVNLQLTEKLISSGPVNFYIINMIGKKVYGDAQINNADNTNLDLSYLPSGVYRIIVNSPIGSFSKSLLID